MGVLVVSGLLCLVLNLLESRRLANETSELRDERAGVTAVADLDGPKLSDPPPQMRIPCSLR